MNFEHISQVKIFLKEISIFSHESSFFCLGDTSINILEGKIPNYYIILSDIEIEKIYSSFENVYHIEIFPFSFSFKFKDEQFFLIASDKNINKFSDSYLKLFIKQISDKSLIIPLIYDIKKGLFKNIKDIFLIDNQVNSTGKLYQYHNEINNRYKKYSISLLKEEDSKMGKINYNDFCFEQYILNIIKFIEKTTNSFKYELSVLFIALTSKESKFLIYELSKTEFFFKIFPILKKCNEHYQSKEYHPEGTLYEHLVLTSMEIESSKFEIKLAALLHDVGKIETMNNGRNSINQRYPNHAYISSKMTKNYLLKFEKFFPFLPDLIEEVCFLIENHMKIAFLPDLEDKQIIEIIKSKYLKELLKLLKADLKASMADLRIYKRVVSFLQKKLGSNFIR